MDVHLGRTLTGAKGIRRIRIFKRQIPNILREDGDRHIALVHLRGFTLACWRAVFRLFVFFVSHD